MNPRDAWQPYEPTASDPWDLRKVAHLHRRAGFGATWAELQRDLRDGPARSIERFLRPPPATDEEKQILDGLRQGVSESADPERLKAWWLYQMLYGREPLREKMTLFWHNHFATSNRKVMSVELMLRQNELLRGQALGNFGELLNGMVSDGAMLVWLDGADSRKSRPNENFGREFLELFTLGPGHYRETDLREAARAFTGWVRFSSGRAGGVDTFAHEATLFDAGEKTFLGKRGRWGSRDIVRIVLEQPAAALFLCRKLYRFFISETEEPSAELLEPIAEELRRQDYSIGYIVGVMLRSRAFFARPVYRHKIKSPVEFSVGMVRTLEVPRAEVSLLALAAACERQGQDLFYPPSVKGWDGGRAWLNSATILERGNWASDVLWGNAELGMSGDDLVAWAKQHGGLEETVPRLIEVLLNGDVAAAVRERAVHAGADRSAEGLRRAVQLLVGCPEYQLA